jgi:outer membrane receptor protein involved in Fe transport
MKKLYLLLILISNLAIAQKISVKGQATDTTGNALPGATVMLLSVKDSTLVNFGVTNTQGAFELKNIAANEYLLKVTFVGYKTYSATITPPSTGAVVELGALKMQVAQTKLDEVVVAERIPVVMKQDTIEYNANAFKTNKNANVEELLKKLPGVEVDNDGNVTAQGERVQRVTVDGKDFFGGRDPKLATKNLPADAVEKVQVLDRKSDQTLFSGIDDGQREKAINLELKEEKRHGAFGNVMAGYGTDNRYQAKASINRFDNGRQLSFLGMGNNINDQGFSMDEYMNFTGGSAQMMGGGGAVRLQFSSDNSNGVPLNFGNRANGIMRNYAGGLNFNTEFNKKTELNGSYFYNFLDHDRLQTTFRENFLQNGSFLYNENTQQNNTNSNQRVNLTLDHKIDSVNSIKLTTNFTYNETDSDVRTSSQNITPEQAVLNENESRSISSGSTMNLASNLLYRHKFAKKNRTFSTNLQFGLSQSERDGLLDATYKFAGDPNDRIVKQRNEQTTDNLSYGATLSYTEPLGGRKYLEANYSFRQNINDVDRPVYDLNNDQQTFNDSLSNKYNSAYTYHRGGLNFKLNRKKYTMTIGAGVQNTHLTGDLEIQDVQIDRSFQNFLPVARFNYDFSNTKHFRFDYETSVQEPTIQQLQPVVDNRDQLNPYQGNPNLRPSYQQSWRANFTTFDPGTFVSFFAFVDVDYTTNAITNSVINENFIRTTTPVNVKDNTSVNTNATFSFPINKIKSRFSITGNWREQQGQNVLDEVGYDITQRTTGGNVRYNYRYKETFDFSLSAQLSRQNTVYEFDQPDQKFFNRTYSAEANLTLAKNYQFNANFDYFQYENKATNFNQTIPLLNLSFSRFFLKGNSGELKVGVNNLLDQALGVNQTSSINYIERTTTNSLGRYYMVSFTYAINKQLNPMGGGMRRGGGMMRVIRN